MDEKQGGIKKIYVCAPYWPESDSRKESEKEQERKKNLKRILLICKLLAKAGYLPLAAALYFPNFTDYDRAVRKREMPAIVVEWILWSDEVWVFGCGDITDTMMDEILIARQKKIPVLTKPEPEELIQKICDEFQAQIERKAAEGRRNNE